MTAHFPLMVPGASADGSMDVQAPFDRSLIATVDVAGASAVEQALTTAHALFRDRDRAAIGAADHHNGKLVVGALKTLADFIDVAGLNAVGDEQNPAFVDAAVFESLNGEFDTTCYTAAECGHDDGR